MFSEADIARYWSRVVPAAGCWAWSGTHNYAGYGVIQMGGRQWRAPRVAWTLVNGPIPDGLQIDHLCFNRSCVNVSHLEVVTGRINMLRRHARKMHCAQGHPWIPENIYLSKRGWRSCLICNRLRWQSKLKGTGASQAARNRWAERSTEERHRIGAKGAATRKAKAEWLRITAA